MNLKNINKKFLYMIENYPFVRYSLAILFGVLGGTFIVYITDNIVNIVLNM